MARPRGVALRTVASVLGVCRGPTATRPGPRQRGGHSLARRCVAAVLGVPLPRAAGPAAGAASPPLHLVHGWTALVPPGDGDPRESPADLPGPPLPLVPPIRSDVRDGFRSGPRRWPRRLLAVTCAAAVLGIGIVLSGVRPFTGTGHVTPVSPASPVSSGALFSLLPRSVQQAGRLTVGTTSIDSAPMVFTFDGELTGLDTDLLNAMAGRLGISFNYTRGDRASLVSDVSTGRVDVAAAGFADTPSRLRRVDFVDYFTAGSAVTVAAANPVNVHSLADLCGKKVAVVADSTDAETLAARNCAAGPIRIASVNTPVHALESVRTGEADAAFTDFPSADFAARQPDSRLAVAGPQIDPGPYGFAVSKSDPQLLQALTAALDAIIDDGTYGRILARYHLTEGAVSAARINGGQ